MVRSLPGKILDEKYMISAKVIPASLMSLGAMCYSGATGLHLLTSGTTINVEKYVELLKEMLAIHMHFHKRTIFIHIGALCNVKKCYELSDDGNGHNAGAARKQS